MARSATLEMLGGAGVMHAGTYDIDPGRSMVEFSVPFAVMTKVHARSTDVAGAVYVRDEPLASWVEARIGAASIGTSQPRLDRMLHSVGMLDVAHYPLVRFRSTRLEPGEGNRFRIVGELTIRDVTKPVAFEARFEDVSHDQRDPDRLAFSAIGEVSRAAFSLTGGGLAETMTALFGDRIRIAMEIAVLRPRGSPPRTEENRHAFAPRTCGDLESYGGTVSVKAWQGLHRFGDRAACCESSR